jgi:HSP20 family molecular chaperone IbpA
MFTQFVAYDVTAKIENDILTVAFQKTTLEQQSQRIAVQ